MVMSHPLPPNESRQIRREKLTLFEIARVLVSFDHVASLIINANHGIM
jgi:hypothetical protein